MYSMTADLNERVIIINCRVLLVLSPYGKGKRTDVASRPIAALTAGVYVHPNICRIIRHLQRKQTRHDVCCNLLFSQACVTHVPFHQAAATLTGGSHTTWSWMMLSQNFGIALRMHQHAHAVHLIYATSCIAPCTTVCLDTLQPMQFPQSSYMSLSLPIVPLPCDT